jgi:hypothetical protein
MGSGRYCLVIAQLPALVCREKFVYPLRTWHFPLPILHMRIVREAKPSAQGINSLTSGHRQRCSGTSDIEDDPSLDRTPSARRSERHMLRPTGTAFGGLHVPAALVRSRRQERRCYPQLHRARHGYGPDVGLRRKKPLRRRPDGAVRSTPPRRRCCAQGRAAPCEDHTDSDNHLAPGPTSDHRSSASRSPFIRTNHLPYALCHDLLA